MIYYYLLTKFIKVCTDTITLNSWSWESSRYIRSKNTEQEHTIVKVEVFPTVPTVLWEPKMDGCN